jgi:hypothetical protein
MLSAKVRDSSTALEMTKLRVNILVLHMHTKLLLRDRAVPWSHLLGFCTRRRSFRRAQHRNAP